MTPWRIGIKAVQIDDKPWIDIRYHRDASLFNHPKKGEVVTVSDVVVEHDGEIGLRFVEYHANGFYDAAAFRPLDPIGELQADLDRILQEGIQEFAPVPEPIPA